MVDETEFEIMDADDISRREDGDADNSDADPRRQPRRKRCTGCGKYVMQGRECADCYDIDW